MSARLIIIGLLMALLIAVSVPVLMLLHSQTQMQQSLDRSIAAGTARGY